MAIDNSILYIKNRIFMEAAALPNLPKIVDLQVIALPDSIDDFLIGWKLKPDDKWQQIKLNIDEDFTPFFVALRLS